MEYPFPTTGLTQAEAEISRKQFGSNAIEKSQSTYWPVIKEIITEPMFLLLVAASSIYFVLGEINEGLFMVAAILVVSAISFFQDTRSRKALMNLKAFTQPKTKVLREGSVIEISTDDVVMNDYVVVEEGTLIPADGLVIQCHDFTVNESILTGESFTVGKDASDPDNNQVYQGTTVSSGLALFKVTQIAHQTRLGKIGKSMEEIEVVKTPLQLQIETFVKGMAIAGALVFLLVWAFNYYLSHDVLNSLLKGLTLAMSILPEEIPVAFTTFMALGAWRLMQQGIIVKQIRTVETLGSATVICTDKTGTITENRMELVQVYAHRAGKAATAAAWNAEEFKKVIEVAMWASEPVAFDPMEKALHAVYSQYTTLDKRIGSDMMHEYPLSGKPPMMTHIFQTAAGEKIIASKGAPESILKYSRLSDDERTRITSEWNKLAGEGYRVLAVAESSWENNDYPGEQHQFSFTFLGLVAFYDPPKHNIEQVFQEFYKAGIQVKVITGDNAATTRSLAQQIHLAGADQSIDGEALMALSDDQLKEHVNRVTVFTRMFPEAKLRIVNALKDTFHIVAMTGDGVNDGPALKAAHIGIAMGKRGSEIAKQASALVLVEDDLSKMIDAIAMGRKIYSNLKKAIQYIISIHIPIILTVALPLFLGWIYPNIFSPVHVIFLEVIMGPTCSIAYENEPLEKNSMLQPPRKMTVNFLKWHELRISILQGLIITAGTLFSYQYAVREGMSEDHTRSMVFVTLIVANIFLTLTNRSFYYSMLTSIRYENQMLRYIIIITLVVMMAIVYVPLLNTFFRLEPLTLVEAGVCAATGFLSVIWFEGYKAWLRYRKG